MAWFVIALLAAAVLVLLTTSRDVVDHGGPRTLARQTRVGMTSETLLVGLLTDGRGDRHRGVGRSGRRGRSQRYLA